MNLLPYFLRTTYWIKDYLEGGSVHRHFNSIKSIMEHTETAELKRKEYLEDLLAFVSGNSPFYAAYTGRSLQDYPIVDKLILRKNYKLIQIAADKIPGQRGALYIDYTSGSTGIPFSLPQDTQKRKRRVAELKYFGEILGFKSHEKLIHLRTWNKWDTLSRISAIRQNIVHFDITNTSPIRLEELCKIIQKEKATTIRGYASSINAWAKFAVDRGLKFPSLKLIIAGSEHLWDSTRELVRDKMGIRIISQYANQENGILAQERIVENTGRPSSFYLNYASYFFEILKLNENAPAKEGEIGRIVLTDLFNYAFPMIRYDTGDTGIMIKSDAYSKGYPVLSKLFGRRTDLVYNTRGTVINPIAVARILKHFSEIIQWQFIQNGERVYLVKLIKNSSNVRLNEIKLELKKLFGTDAEISFEFTEEIPVLDSGKRRMVINNWKKEENYTEK